MPKISHFPQSGKRDFCSNLGLGGTIEGQRDKGVRHPLVRADFVVVALAVPVLLRGRGLELVRHVQVEAVEAADKAGRDAVLAYGEADEVLNGGPGDPWEQIALKMLARTKEYYGSKRELFAHGFSNVAKHTVTFFEI